MSATTLTAPATRAPAAPATPRKRRLLGRERPNVLGAIGGVVWLAIIIVPVYYVVISSLRNQAGFFAQNPLAPPTHPTLDNYRLVFQSNFWLFFRNSVIITVVAVALIAIFGLMAAYVVVRSQGRIARRSFQLFLLGIAIPTHATIIPLYYMITKLHLYDSLAALILPTVGFAIPITVIILSNFIRDIPGELFESMRLDGAGDWRLLWNLVVPLSRPALATVAIYNALHVWNGFLFPLILTQSEKYRVLPMALWAFQGEFTVNVPAILAAVVLSTIPLLAAYIFGRRYLVSGLTAGVGK